jgi:hypothetical protein
LPPHEDIDLEQMVTLIFYNLRKDKHFAKAFKRMLSLELHQVTAGVGDGGVDQVNRVPGMFQ